jgi:hypothetical protein
MHHEPFADLAQRQTSRGAERQQLQHLVAGERDAERLQHRVELGTDELLHAHDRRRQTHRRRIAHVPRPDLSRALDGIERQLGVRGHAPIVEVTISTRKTQGRQVAHTGTGY